MFFPVNVFAAQSDKRTRSTLISNNNQNKPKNGPPRQERRPNQKQPKLAVSRPMRKLAQKTRAPRSYGQQSLSSAIEGMAHSADYAAACNAYLNPGHAANYSNARPLPDGGAGRVYIYRTQWTRTITTADVAGTNELTFAMIPSFEYPFMICDPKTGVAKGIPAPKSIVGNTPATFLKDNHVYAFRCLGKSLTCTNTSAIFDLKGGLHCVHKPQDTDYGMLENTDSYIRTTGANKRILQRMPMSQSAATDLGNASSSNPKDGFYMVSAHATHDWMERDMVYKKVQPDIVTGTSPQVAADTATALYYTDATTGTMYALADINAPTLKCLSSGFDNTDIAIASLSGVTGVQAFSVKFTVVFEFQLKASSSLYSDSVYRPPCNLRLIEALIAYESARSRDPGGGTLLAADNDWNAIWTGFKSYVSKAGDWGRSLAANFGITDIASGLSVAGKIAPYLLAL